MQTLGVMLFMSVFIILIIWAAPEPTPPDEDENRSSKK